ncbi:HAD superfamily phosphatase (TIGR01668 family) [Aequitasia blattaphilus]|uniref:YqeG family HAD IIIA-type phosphatase n=1 Tax=Aequitasia blattaphilus TaxID=2949332 RepID=A0ABT1E7E3_9FIRM|nr:YqeG family HAD IIIA-type phosphatase [Aequitasia blattaphilus]MCP1101750.1 YqeG family HAD IIIA-type phosphatase [Aequitasia blattaphilus]MCR8614390.1 YqeG family HAD IIIA-type phosphatase [Aequitasia blattaphilus]
MLEKFYPNEYRNSVYNINFEEFYRKGYRGVIFDIDNTLVPHGAPATEEVKVFFAKLKEIGFSACLLSNNKEPRVASFNEEIKVNAIWDGKKPRKDNYIKAMSLMGTNRQTTLFVGDQLFTDVWGAKRIGIYNILTKPIHPKEEIQIVLKRYLERIVLRSYQKNKLKKG